DNNGSFARRFATCIGEGSRIRIAASARNHYCGRADIQSDAHALYNAGCISLHGPFQRVVAALSQEANDHRARGNRLTMRRCLDKLARQFALITSIFAAVLVDSCNLAPKYHTPAAEAP